MVVAIALLFIGTSNRLLLAQSLDASDHLLEIGVKDSLYSSILQEQRAYWVHLPISGHLEEGQRYPVIYLLDGETHLGGLAAVQEYYTHFRMPEMIVVGISNRDNRTRDLTPTRISSRNGMPVASSGESEKFSSFLADELIPRIDEQYPTTAHRVLVGHSYGGLFVINTLVNHPELFTNYVALDPSLDWDNQQWIRTTLRSLESTDLKGKGLFVAVANEIIRFSDTETVETVIADTSVFSQGIRSSLTFVRRLESGLAEGLRFGWKFYDQDIHGSIPLVGMRDGFVFLYDFWELKSPSLYNDPDTQSDTIVSLIRAQSDARTTGMGYPLPMEEDLLEMLAFMSLDAAQPNKARAILEVSVEYYPESASVHAALVEACLVLADWECAETHARIGDLLTGDSKLARNVANARSKQ